MRIAGVLGSSLIDYPERIACVVFLQGCNWNCTYCHNQALIPLVAVEDTVSPSQGGLCEPLSASDSVHVVPRSRERNRVSTPEELYALLERRRTLLDGVVITGGEPTIHADLPLLLEKIRTMGFAVKLDTNGSNPKMVQDLLSAHLLDYIALDIKAPWNRYTQICGPQANPLRVQQTLEMLKNSDIGWEARTTLCPQLTDEDIAWLEQGAQGVWNEKSIGDVPINA